MSLLAWRAQHRGPPLGALAPEDSAEALCNRVTIALAGIPTPRALVIGAAGRVGRGVSDLCARADVPVTAWDVAETTHGGPFPQVLAHDLFFNAVLAAPGIPVFVPARGVSGRAHAQGHRRYLL